MPDPESPRLRRAVRRHAAPALLHRPATCARAVAIADLRAMTHKRMPRFVLEYLEGGAEEEASLARDRTAYADWRFMPRQLVDVSQRSLEAPVLGRPAPLPLVIAPTGLNGLFRPPRRHRAGAGGGAHSACRSCRARCRTTRWRTSAEVPNLRHWWQLYVFGGDEVWQELLRRADAAGCEALVLTTNAQIFGNREWSAARRATKTRPSLPTVLDAALHPRWLASTLLDARHAGVPQRHRLRARATSAASSRARSGCASTSRRRCRGTRWTASASAGASRCCSRASCNLDDVRRAIDAGVDGIVLSSHGGRQLDWHRGAAGPAAAPRARSSATASRCIISGGLRRGTDLLKALALGADAVLAGRAPLYGVCAGGEAGVERALEILKTEAFDAMGLLGARSVEELGPHLLAHVGGLSAHPVGRW